MRAAALGLKRKKADSRESAFFGIGAQEKT